VEKAFSSMSQLHFVVNFMECVCAMLVKIILLPLKDFNTIHQSKAVLPGSEPAQHAA
jgi:hypothetical protein